MQDTETVAGENQPFTGLQMNTSRNCSGGRKNPCFKGTKTQLAQDCVLQPRVSNSLRVRAFVSRFSVSWRTAANHQNKPEHNRQEHKHCNHQEQLAASLYPPDDLIVGRCVCVCVRAWRRLSACALYGEVWEPVPGKEGRRAGL